MIRLPVFARTRRYDWFATINYSVFLVLPFLLMWSLGVTLALTPVLLFLFLFAKI